MEIGLGAHSGTTAEIHPGPVGGHTGKSVVLTLVLLTIACVLAYFGVQYIRKSKQNETLRNEMQKHGSTTTDIIRPVEQGLWRNKYLPSSKNNEVADDNSLLDGASVKTGGTN